MKILKSYAALQHELLFRYPIFVFLVFFFGVLDFRSQGFKVMVHLS